VWDSRQRRLTAALFAIAGPLDGGWRSRAEQPHGKGMMHEASRAS